MNLHDWANLATVLLCVEALIMGLIALVVVYALGRACSYVLREAPRLFVHVRTYALRIHSGATQVTDLVAAPVVRVAGFLAGVRGLARGIRRLVAARL